MNKQAIIEAIKEVARLAFFAAISAVIAWATTKLAKLDPNSVYVIVGTVILRAADRYVHKDDGLKVNGLAPF